MLHYNPGHVSSSTMFIFRRTNCVIAASGIVAVCKRPYSMPVESSSYFPPVKDAFGLRTPGVYSIPCECGEVYIGQSGRPIQHSIKEHNRHIRLAQPNKSAVAEHSINHNH